MEENTNTTALKGPGLGDLPRQDSGRSGKLFGVTNLGSSVRSLVGTEDGQPQSEEELRRSRSEAFEKDEEGATAAEELPSTPLETLLADFNITQLENYQTQGHERYTTQGIGCYDKSIQRFEAQLQARDESYERIKH